MHTLAVRYQQLLNLENTIFVRIDHEDAMVALVYKVLLQDGAELILKICSRENDYRREVYFLNYLADIVPVPRIIQTIAPTHEIQGAILMECLPGKLLKTAEYSSDLAYEIGGALARIHANPSAGYGDLIFPNELSEDSVFHFTQKFEEGFEECRGNVPDILLERCRTYYNAHAPLLADLADGPCITHRDFRPGNLIVKDDKLQGVIDWSSARASFAQEDFCPIEFGEWTFNMAQKEAFFAGYAQIRTVPEYGVLMPLLRLSRALGVIGFTVKRGIWNTSHSRLYRANREFLEAFLLHKK